MRNAVGKSSQHKGWTVRIWNTSDLCPACIVTSTVAHPCMLLKPLGALAGGEVPATWPKSHGHAAFAFAQWPFAP